MNNEQSIFDKLKEQFQEKVQEAYIAGAHEGAITTAAILYNIMKTVGLEETNILFSILKDIAHQHGCEDLNEVAERLRAKNNNTDSSMLSWFFIKNII